jgi:hypothetical protein
MHNGTRVLRYRQYHCHGQTLGWDHKSCKCVVCSLEVVMRVAIVLSTLFLAGGAAVMASSLLQDPHILIDTGGDAIPISSGIDQVQPNGMQTVTYDFFNDTPDNITGFDFQTTINIGLSSAAAASFTCSDPAGYFATCSANYDPLTGDLRYLFSGPGVKPGIPPGADFIITLQGWTPDVMSAGETLYNGLPTLDNSFTTSGAPEPSVAITLGSGLLLLAAMWRRRRTVR